MRRLLIALFILLSSPISVASALDAPSKRQPHYTAFTAICTLGTNRFALNLIFDRRLDSEDVKPAVGGALARAGLQSENCSRSQMTESDEPSVSPDALEPGLRLLTLVVYSGGVPEPGVTENPYFETVFDDFRPHIFIDDTGKWSANRNGTHCESPFCHPPVSISYTSPHTFIRCTNSSKLESEAIASDHLVQILHMRCAGNALIAQDLFFFGLASFASGVPDGTSSNISIQGMAFLALEFEVKRAVVALFGTPH